MMRRIVLAIPLVSFVLGSCVRAPEVRGRLHPIVKPNLVIILSDDQRWDTLGLEHTADGVRPVMPLVEAELVASGVTFTNGFVTRALCCPSRASILKGQYAHSTGVLTNGPPHGGATSFDDSSTLATWLRGTGYRTGLFGKYLNGYTDLWTPPAPPYVPPGWDEWHAFEEPGYWNYRLIEHGTGYDHARNFYDSGCTGTSGCLDECTGKRHYSTDELLAKAVAFIEQSAGRPFFLYLAPYGPHAPSCPAERHRRMFDDVPPWRPPGYDEAGDAADKPAWVRRLCPMSDVTRQAIDHRRRMMLASLQAVDEAVGTVMAELRRLGLDDRTLVLYSSDNGFAWGEHCRQAKQCAYEECMRVPLVVRYPPLVPQARVEPGFGLNIDFALTLAELAGVLPPVAQDGRSLVSLLQGSEPAWRTDFLFEHWDANGDPTNGIPTLAAVRNQGWKYVEYVTREKELYRLDADPYELRNQSGNPAYADVEAALAARLRALRPDWAR